jgi:hypothetical protein
MNMKFTDGVEIDIDGPDRKVRLKDGWYVVGGGCLIPCNDEAEADEILKELLKGGQDEI